MRLTHATFFIHSIKPKRVYISMSRLFNIGRKVNITVHGFKKIHQYLIRILLRQRQKYTLFNYMERNIS